MDSKVAEARFEYIPVSSQTKQIISYKVQRTKLELQDYESIKLDEITLIDIDDLFRVRKHDI